MKTQKEFSVSKDTLQLRFWCGLAYVRHILKYVRHIFCRLQQAEETKRSRGMQRCRHTAFAALAGRRLLEHVHGGTSNPCLRLFEPEDVGYRGRRVETHVHFLELSSLPDVLAGYYEGHFHF